MNDFKGRHIQTFPLTDLEVFISSQPRRLSGRDDMLRSPHRTRRIERHDPSTERSRGRTRAQGCRVLYTELRLESGRGRNPKGLADAA